MKNTVSVVKLRRDIGEYLSQVRYQARRLIITRRDEEIAALVPISDLERLEGDMPDAQPEMTTDEYEALERDGLGGYLAANALSLSRFDVAAARRALLDALLKLEGGA